MSAPIDAFNLHRTAKLFMDDGTAATAQEALDRLRGFGLTIVVGPTIAASRPAQIALLTLVNVARRTFLGGVDVMGLPDAPALAFHPGQSLSDAVRALGGRPGTMAPEGVPVAAIGMDAPEVAGIPAWRVTWRGWAGGVVPARGWPGLTDDGDVALAPALAAAVCAAEVFAWHAGERSSGVVRPAGLSLWTPGAEWLETDPSAPPTLHLPSSLWLIGLGNLGQAFAWLLAALPYADPSEVTLMLQDDDEVGESNDSTSLLSDLTLVGRRKARVVAEWLEARGFATWVEERRFGPWTRRAPDEPSAALCGVDNQLARAALEDAGFGLVVEAGLGAGPQAFRSLSVHAFPSSRTARGIWGDVDAGRGTDAAGQPAYTALGNAGMDPCGLARLASRTVGAPFVGLAAACLGMSELLRRLNGGVPREVIAGSMSSLRDVEAVEGERVPYTFGAVEVDGGRVPTSS